VEPDNGGTGKGMSASIPSEEAAEVMQQYEDTCDISITFTTRIDLTSLHLTDTAPWYNAPGGIGTIYGITAVLQLVPIMTLM